MHAGNELLALTIVVWSSLVAAVAVFVHLTRKAPRKKHPHDGGAPFPPR
jgi:hypothetical protein